MTPESIEYFVIGTLMLIFEFIWREKRGSTTMMMLSIYIAALPMLMIAVAFSDFIQASIIIRVIIAIPLGFLIWYFEYKLIGSIWFNLGGK